MSYGILLVLRESSRDRRLGGGDLRVLCYLLSILDPWEWRPVKAEAVGRDIGMGRPEVARAMRRLTASGYVYRGADDPEAPRVARQVGPAWYRLAQAPRCALHEPRR